MNIAVLALVLMRARAAVALSAIPPPRTLSPTACSDWRQCPHMYRLKHIEKRPQAPSTALERGIAVHAALERLFDAPPAGRSLAAAEDLLREAWGARRTEALLEELFGDAADGDAAAGAGDGDADARAARRLVRERRWGLDALAMLARYFEMEAPAELAPRAREKRFRVALDAPSDGAPPSAAPLVVTGVLDRLDDADDGGLCVVDYKTGKAPGGARSYGPATDARIAREKWFALRVYALLWKRSQGAAGAAAAAPPPVSRLRLIYLGDEAGAVEHVTPLAAALDGGAGAPATAADARAAADAVLAATEDELRAVWAEIVDACARDAFEPRTSKLCDYCSFRGECPAFGAAPEQPDAAEAQQEEGAEARALAALTLAVLRERCRAEKLKVSGRKADLVERLVAASGRRP